MKGKQLHLFGIEPDTKSERIRQSFNLPLDTLILMGVVVGLLLTVAFSLGVERGRKMSYLDTKKKELANFSVDKLENQGTIEQAKTTPGKLRKLEIEVQEPEIDQNPQPEKNSQDSGQKYRIQVASYAGSQRAQQEVEKLKNKGYPALVLQKGQYMVVFVGEFSDKQEAREKMQSLKSSYSDCFIRVVKK